jgi:ubiquinone/menaquinone biosynthesis C-methylase UbiE
MTQTNAAQGFYGTSYAGSATENYERYFVPAIGGPLADQLVAAAALRPGERVLDVACGTGIVARLAADRVGPAGKVAGADVNPGMLAVARAAAAASGRTSIQWYETAAEAMPLPDAAYDVVFCQLALQFFSDKIAALREMRRVLVPGGRAYATVPASTAFFDVLEKAVTRHVGPEIGMFVGQVFSLSEPGELEGLYRSAGFDEVRVRMETTSLRLPAARDFLWQYVYSTPLSGPIGRLNVEGRAALEHDVVAGWARWAADDGLTCEQPILTASARK